VKKTLRQIGDIVKRQSETDRRYNHKRQTDRERQTDGDTIKRDSRIQVGYIIIRRAERERERDTHTHTHRDRR